MKKKEAPKSKGRQLQDTELESIAGGVSSSSSSSSRRTTRRFSSSSSSFK